MVSLEQEDIQKYDLTNTIVKYLDRHMVIPLIEFLSNNTQLYNKDDLKKAKLELLSETRMVDYYNQLNNEIYSKDIDGFNTHREQVLSEIKTAETASNQIIDILSNPEITQQLRYDKLSNIQFLQEKTNFKPELLDSLYNFATIAFDTGNYVVAAEHLYHFLILSTDHKQNENALWGKLAANILTENWNEAYQDLDKIKLLIEEEYDSKNQIHSFQQRSWLLHWSLFVYFNHPKGKDGIVDLFLQPHYLNVIQTSCPWLLRYLCAALLTNRKHKHKLLELVRYIEQESSTYSDPITKFLECLYIDYNFDEAQLMLKKCDEVIHNDFFLTSLKDNFIECARFFIFEAYCKIHEEIDIGELSEKLNLSSEDGEKWVVNLIRETRMDGKIDSESFTVRMATHHSSVYQSIIDKTRSYF